AALKAAPQKALYPQPVLNPARAGWRFWLLMPLIFVRMMRTQARLRRFGETFAVRFRGEILPAFMEDVKAFALAEDVLALLAQLHKWSERTLVTFARDSLKPTVLAAAALGNLERALLPILGPDAARAALGELVLHVHPDADADLPKAIRDVLMGQMS